MKTTRKFSKVTFMFDGDDQANMMMKLSEKSNDIGNLMGGKFGNYLAKMDLLDENAKEGFKKTFKIQTEADLDILWEISDWYEEIGQMLGDEFKLFLIEINNALSSEKILEPDEKAIF